MFILISLSFCLAQTEKLDKIELGSGKIMLGKVEKIKSNSVEFIENHTNDLYEFKKSEIRYIDLANGEILTFKEFNDTKGVDQAAPSSQTAEVAQDDDLSAGSIVIISVGVGYGSLKMNDVNNDLKDSKNFIGELGLIADSPDLIADAGELKGDHIENGINFEDMPVRDVNGNGISFDYSGFLATVGISLVF